MGGRPYTLVVPSGYAGQPAPLVIMLHGYGSTAAFHESYFGLRAVGEARGFLYAYADGTPDQLGNRYWNASDACCGFPAGDKPDDVAFFAGLIDDVRARYAVDPGRVFVFGHSNGGFMAHRLGCDLADRITGVVSLAGATWKDPARCAPTRPVAVLELHAETDAVALYGGGSLYPGWPPYPSAPDTVATWAVKNGCAPTLAASSSTIDLVLSAPDAETLRQRHEGCAGGAAELWTMRGLLPATAHMPSFVASWSATLYDWLAAHPRP